ncbi:hypothetical protein [Xanthomonas albilineans]|uniref:hypothetical protein n=1 Tax=Xanthomonas albilineans TaxID=29447 RepID=UPI0027D99C35|nr:hypothetical protein [Xanthomonas albilineans]
MLKQESLVSLFSLLQEMTFVNRDKEIFISPVWIRQMEIITGYFYFGVAIAFLVSAFFQYMLPSPINLFLVYLFYDALCIFGIACVFSLVLSQIVSFWVNRKRGLSIQFFRLKIDMLADANFLDKLQCYDKAVLEYALLKYRNSFNMLDIRAGLLIGDLRKIGLFPASIVLVIAASTLIKNNNSIYFGAPLILAAIFYLVGIIFRARQERAEQVIDLLDYAILHSEVVTEQK